MSAHEHEPPAVTADDIADLRQGLDDLAGAIGELRAAQTPAAKEEARDNIGDAEADLEDMARKLGVSRTRLDESIKAARQAERKEELLPIMRELLDDIQAAADDDDDDDPDPEPKGKAKRKRTPAPPNEPDPAPPAPADSEPAKPHWSESSVGGILR